MSLVQEREATAGAPHRVGGVTVIVNLLDTAMPRYVIVKGMDEGPRFEEMDHFAAANAHDPLRQLYVAPSDHEHRFAALHLPIDES